MIAGFARRPTTGLPSPVGRALERRAAALGRQDERVGVVDLLATAALLALADREREASRAVELHDLDIGRLRLAGEDLLGAVRRAQRGRPAGDRGHGELRLFVRPLRVVLDVREGVEDLLRRRVDVQGPVVGHRVSPPSGCLPGERRIVQHGLT
jgi:hypothetical protein